MTKGCLCELRHPPYSSRALSHKLACSLSLSPSSKSVSKGFPSIFVATRDRASISFSFARPILQTCIHLFQLRSSHLAAKVMRDFQTRENVRSIGSTSSEAPRFSGRCTQKSLAAELDEAFKEVSLSPADFFDRAEGPRNSHEGTTEHAESVRDVISEDCERRTTTPGELSPSTTVESDIETPATSVDNNRSPTDTTSISALGQKYKKSHFVEQISPVNLAAKPLSLKERTKLLAVVHNRELIDRNADGFFVMKTAPSATDVQGRVQQAEGIAALQRTLVPVALSNAASSSTDNSHTSSFTAAEPVERPSSLRQLTFAEPRDRRVKQVQVPPPPTASRSRVATRFSLGRDLVAAGYKKRLAEPSAPARFVKLPTDPVLNFKRNFADCGLKIRIPEPETEEDEGDDSGSFTTIPEFDSADGFSFRTTGPGIDRHLDSTAQEFAPKLEFGVRGASIPNQCLEPLCPVKGPHAKGPYHHLGHRDNKIMTGLFGHSNPPPAIWNAYRNMVQITGDGQMLSPERCPASEAEQELVVAFAINHYGQLNGMNGEEFHRYYAGKHWSSRIAPRSSSTNSSGGSVEVCTEIRK